MTVTVHIVTYDGSLELMHEFETDASVVPIVGDTIGLGNRLLMVERRLWPITIGRPIVVTLYCSDVAPADPAERVR